MFDENARGTNLLDTGAHFYDVYRCSDGKYISLGSIEPQFYAELLRLTGLDGDEQFAEQMDKAEWPALKARLTEVFAQKPRAEWCEIMEATDVCFAPVLTMSEAARASAQRRTQHVHRRRRNHAACAGPAVQPDGAGGVEATRVRRRAHPRGVRRLGRRRRP